jgi:hypothetical protein
MCFIEIKGYDIEKMEGDMMESTMDGCIIQAGSIEHMARQVQDGFTTGNRALDWALALHDSDSESDGVLYTKFEDRLRAHPGEHIAILVHQHIKLLDGLETTYNAHAHGSLERLRLGSLKHPVPEPPLRWDKGELLLPVAHIVEVVAYARGYVELKKPLVRASRAGLPLCALCAPGFPLTLREFVCDCHNESIIRVGKQEVGRFIASTYTCLQQDFERALALVGQPSLDFGE